MSKSFKLVIRAIAIIVCALHPYTRVSQIRVISRYKSGELRLESLEFADGSQASGCVEQMEQQVTLIAQKRVCNARRTAHRRLAVEALLRRQNGRFVVERKWFWHGEVSRRRRTRQRRLQLPLWFLQARNGAFVLETWN